MINITTFPKSSRVYMFKSNDDIIYIGSSKNLYQRIATHNTYIKKGSNAKQNPDLYKFLSTSPFTIEYQLTDDYRKLEQKLIEQYKPKFNAIRANTGLGAYKGRNAEYMKEYCNQYYESHREEVLEQKKQYKNQLCLYNGKTLTLNALSLRFKRQGIEHPTIEAKQYLIRNK